jgi:hypothetical protein
MASAGSYISASFTRVGVVNGGPDRTDRTASLPTDAGTSKAIHPERVVPGGCCWSKPCPAPPGYGPPAGYLVPSASRRELEELDIDAGAFPTFLALAYTMTNWPRVGLYALAPPDFAVASTSMWCLPNTILVTVISNDPLSKGFPCSARKAVGSDGLTVVGPPDVAASFPPQLVSARAATATRTAFAQFIVLPLRSAFLQASVLRPLLVLEWPRSRGARASRAPPPGVQRTPGGRTRLSTSRSPSGRRVILGYTFGYEDRDLGT